MNKYEINKRVKQLRKSLHFNNERFAKLINIPTSYIYDYETDKKEVSEKVITDICRRLSVNEQWLRTGNGDMFLKYNENIITDLAKEFNLDEEDKKFIHYYVYLSKDERNVLRDRLLMSKD